MHDIFFLIISASSEGSDKPTLMPESLLLARADAVGRGTGGQDSHGVLLIFSYIRRLGPILGVQILNFYIKINVQNGDI